MPTSIPYDPSLALGNIVLPGALETLTEISELQAPIESAQENLNSLISLKRSLDMTIDELANMSINPQALMAKSGDVKKSISEAAINYATIRLEQETKIQPLRAKIRTVHQSVESPIDYNRSKITSMPLSADSLKMDAQYFMFDENEQEASTTMSSMKEFFTEAFSFMGDSEALNMASSAMKQVNKQRQAHDVEGTLVITATCTHKDAQLFAPLMLDVDKAIRVWNQLFPGSGDMININDKASIAKIIEQQGTPNDKAFQILSGATYGSSFVGMVHVLKSEETTSSQTMTDTADLIQAQVEEGLSFAGLSGGIGDSDELVSSVKDLLSTAKVTSHVSVLTMGVIASIKANDMAYAINQFADEDWNDMGKKVATLANATEAEQTSMAQAASAARTGQQMVAMEGTKITSTLTALAKVEGEKNRVLDINSMMAAFDDYLTKVGTAGTPTGVPINYYLKPITRSQLAQMWLNKYYPGKYVGGLAGDDEGKSTAAPAPAGAAATGQ